jgi:hypothetical protein
MSRCNKRQATRSLLIASTVVGLAWSATLTASARPGGGNSYSGGSHSSGGGSGGGSGDAMGLLFQLVLLCIDYPAIGVPVLLILVLSVVGKAIVDGMKTSWSTTSAAAVQAVAQVEQTRNSSRMDFDRIRALDPDFSLVLFEDFVYMLYAAVQRARAAGSQTLAVYLAPPLAQALLDEQLSDVRGIVIGAMRYVRFSGTEGAMLEVQLELEANFVEVQKSGGSRRFYVSDRMVLTRARSARSRPFARAHVLDCPNCGAPLEAMRGTHCSYCQRDVGLGRFDWMITSLVNRAREPRGPLLTSDVAETGTELPTIVDRGAAARFAELQQKDPAITWQALEERARYVFAELQVAWSGRDPLRIRPHVSDNLFQSMYYWIDLYTQAHCRNVTENARIMRLDLANVMSDLHYDAITLRVFATGLDYTISDDGKLLSGSRSRPRTYSEYWTLIRGTARRGAQPTPQSGRCPNCGAPLKIGMAGQCEYCRVKVSSGEFDWVLSRIEQDDSYGG